MVSGISVSTTSGFGCAPRTITRGVRTACSSASCASARLPSVADSPHTCNAGRQPASRARASWVWVPRLLPSSSCHSSTTTSRSRASVSRASARVSSSDRLSGVVTSADGRRRFCRLRSADGVSPVRSPTVHGTPRPDTAACRARAVSAASARIGVTQSTVSGAGRRPARTAAGAPGSAGAARAPSRSAPSRSAPSAAAAPPPSSPA